MQLSPEDVAIIAEWAEANPCMVEVRLFGRRARGRAAPNSDVDVAVTLVSGTGDVTDERCLNLYNSTGKDWELELRLLLGGDVSLVHLSPASPAYPTIIAEGVLLWARG